jgi:hypothetical protein
LIRTIGTLLLTVTVGFALGASPSVAGGGGLPPTMLGPGDAHVHGIKDEALIRMSTWGYVYIAGQQDSRLKITFDQGSNSIRYRDTGTKRLDGIPKRCHRETVGRGISVRCTIPPRFAKRMFVQVWPRLGNDYVDAHTLGPRFRVWVLTDAGNDVVYCGSGADFVNGAKGADRIYGGPGNDWLRGGPGRDLIRGGAGKDRIAIN